MTSLPSHRPLWKWKWSYQRKANQCLAIFYSPECDPKEWQRATRIGQTVQIEQRTIKDTPPQKLYDVLISILAGSHGLVKINRRLRADACDTKLAAPALDTYVVTCPEPCEGAPPILCLVATFGSEKTEQVVRERKDIAHIRPRGEEAAQVRSMDSPKKPRRRVVERLHTWLNRSRCLLVCWEKRTETCEAFVHLA